VNHTHQKRKPKKKKKGNYINEKMKKEIYIISGGFFVKEKVYQH
jgi:hypothetical protein